MQTFQMLGKRYDDSVYISDENVSEDGRYVSEAEYRAKYYNHPDFNYEWKNGYLEEKTMADVKSSIVYDWFSDILKCYLSAYPIGTTVNLEIGFRLELPEDTSIRKPDRAVVLHDNAVSKVPRPYNPKQNPEDVRIFMENFADDIKKEI